MYQYSNSLIRQFPSAVTGNAAVGVQATVYVGETGAKASLFESNGTTPKANPVTTDGKGFYSFSLADGDYRIVFSSSQFATLRISVLDGAQLREDFEDLVASNTEFRNQQQAAYDSFVLSQGWDQSGTFAAGFTYTSPNQVGQDVDGNWWRWNGSLPKVVTAGTFPSSDANYKLVGDGVLRSDLAAADSETPIAGQQAKKYFATFDTIAEMQSAITSDYVGRRVQWLGYHALSDGGSGWGTVKSGPYTADGGKIISVGTNLYIEQNIKGFQLNVRKYGVRGDAATNDTLQMQRCLNSGHKNIVVPRGVFILDSLTFPDYITVTGTGYQAGVAGGDRITEFRFSITNSSNAITCGQEPVIKNIIFFNVGGTYSEETKTLSGTTAGCIKLSANAVIEECSFYLWHQCIRTGPSTFYLTTDKVEFNRCTSGYVAEDTSPYNMNIRAPKSSLTEFFVVGVGDNTPRNIKVMGGAIEGYTAVAVRFIDIAFFGTYFESEPERTVFNAIEPQVSGSNVSLFGCTIFMNRTARFVNMSGLNNVGLTGSGNTFTGAMSSAGIAYFLPSSGSVSLAGDSIDPNIASNLSYVDSIAQAQFSGGIKMPQLQALSPQALYSDIMFTGQRGFIAFELSAEPANRISGQMLLANGVSWDPLALSSGRPYYVIWQGDRWRSVSG